ncbi:heme-binding protein [Rhizobium sp. CNPSo 4039]|uniref:GlcG/HbpS family heme-binding protein n=1 Tax=unclassified Rhizobium TaxID=2613769 RepID=UPI00254AC5BF|nr:heme-binding protein [Rhizobium sp. CNPSo 4039]MDK4716042.1 heme-binding protein [Rhizobium sp. CNPSo 4039]
MYAPQITLGGASALLTAAEKKATAIGVKSTIVVLDRGGELVSMARMDGAWPGAFDVAVGKAQTARSFHAPSATFVPMIQPGEALYSINSVAEGKYVILGGGLPLEIDGHIVGAVGVSGGTVDQDIAVAEAGLLAFSSSIERK